jgi:hypothetical protein
MKRNGDTPLGSSGRTALRADHSTRARARARARQACACRETRVLVLVNLRPHYFSCSPFFGA